MSGTKENNKNAGNTQLNKKKFMGGNINLQGKTFELTSSRDCVHQYAETVKPIADYVGYILGGDIRFMIESLQDYNFTRPPDPPNGASQYEIESWKKQLDMYWKRRGIYMDNKMKLFSLIWGQSSKTTQSKVETHQNFATCKNDYDSLVLLRILREFVFRSDDHQYKYKAEDQAKRAYYNLRQTPEMSCQEYFERVRNIVEVIKSIRGSLVDDMHLSDELPPTQPIGGYTDDQYAAARERIMNKKIAYGILVRADRGRYGKLIEEVENAYLKGNNDYPTTPTESYNLLVNYKTYSSNKRTISQGGLEQVAFVTEGKKLKTGKEFPHIKCFKCGKFGHYKSDCAESDNGKEVSQEVCHVIQATSLMTQAKSVNGRQGIDPMWFLCDNESTVDIIKNKAMVTNIRTTNNPVEITGIGGMPVRVYQVGVLLGYGTVYYHPVVTTNIISFNHLVKRFKSVKYDNNVKDAFVITRVDNSTMEFAPSTDGLYHYAFNLSIKRRLELEKIQKAKTMVIQTVEGIK
jgi:hypothetical protein